jgi:phosphoenolpyruvate carboxykinase (diphosphate)
MHDEAATSAALLPDLPDSRDPRVLAYLNLKLRELGQPGVELPADDGAAALSNLVDHFLVLAREKDRLLSRHLCPVDQRIQNFLYANLEEFGGVPHLPAATLVLDRPGLARALSLPPSADEHKSSILTSTRLHNGILHNPKSDRRTTQGIFHVSEGGLPIPDDKKAVPAAVFSRLLRHALNPPDELLALPFTAVSAKPAHAFVSLYLRPVVVPEVPGFTPARRMETRFFIPGALVANLDFVESIFGNAGDPGLPANDSALDPEHWTGHTGCIILAPHLNGLKKKDLGLPAWEDASERQRRDGMCWKSADEPYNDGVAFKCTSRDASGVVVTIISDNYFGYCKKEVKTQISFAANLLGLAEEEHAGGALAFPSYDLGEEFSLLSVFPESETSLDKALVLLGARALSQPGGWARDAEYPDIYYVPGDAHFDLRTQRIAWGPAEKPVHSLKLLPGVTYVLPSGYKVEMVRPDANSRWRLRGTTAEGILCHKPCTVSGGGKSEISKSIADATFSGPVFISDAEKDLDLVEAILKRDYSVIYRDPARNKSPRAGRPILSSKRSLGSVVKLLSRSPDYTDEYNAWLGTIPRYIRDLVLLVKRVHKAEHGDDWRRHFAVDAINGRPGNELKYHGVRATTQFLRIGYAKDGGWRTFSLRSDFLPAVKIQAEDDITASTVAPAGVVKGLPADLAGSAASIKVVHNCETRLFQRPDDAIVRGYDKHAEKDFAGRRNFFSNYEALPHSSIADLLEDTLGFDAYTPPLKDLVHDFAAKPNAGYVALPSHPRIVDGKPTKNPRYLQVRPDLLDPRATALARVGARLSRKIAADAPVVFPVGAVLMGRRLNPPEKGVRPLCVFNPIHYQELPEAFMDLIASLTGKSPSTTGAGSEGALTKGPFNALPPIFDLNAALVSFLLTDLPAFSTAAGWVGPKLRVDHDISLLVPEIWCRMSAEERTPKFLIENGYLVRCTDFVHDGKPVLASRLGWRITDRFVQAFFGRVMSNPSTVFDEEHLKPELTDAGVFADGMENIVGAMKEAADHYFADGSVEQACPPLRALLHIMRDGAWEGKGLDSPDVRRLFDRAEMLKSDWYKARLEAKRTIDAATWESHARYLERFLRRANYADVAVKLDIKGKLDRVVEHVRAAKGPGYVDSLRGTLGGEPAVARDIAYAHRV